jgi:hypothetical protein
MESVTQVLTTPSGAYSMDIHRGNFCFSRALFVLDGVAEGTEFSLAVGLSTENGLAEGGLTVDRGESRRSAAVENLVAKGEAVDGRGFRLTDDVDDTVERPLGRPLVLEIDGILDLFGKGSSGGLLTEEAEGRSDEA